MERIYPIRQDFAGVTERCIHARHFGSPGLEWRLRTRKAVSPPTRDDRWALWLLMETLQDIQGQSLSVNIVLIIHNM